MHGNIASASHELKTLLAILYTRADLIEFRHKRDKSIDEPLNELRFDVDRMNMIISNLLDVVQADNPENTVNAAHDGVRGVIGKGKTLLNSIIHSACLQYFSLIFQGKSVSRMRSCQCFVDYNWHVGSEKYESKK